MAQGTAEMIDGAVILRPYAHLASRGILAALALTTPIFAVAYWLAIPTSSWAIVLGLHAVVLALMIVAILVFLATSVEIDDHIVRERRPFGRVNEIDRDEVGEILLVDLYQNIALESRPQFFVLDQSDHLVIRLRGQIWSRESMDRIARALDTEITVLPDSMTMSEMRRRSPHLLSWFERFPAFRSVARGGDLG